MKKLLAILAICLLVPGVAWGAIAATTVWEIRATATAADVNGGGFNPANVNMLADLTCTACDTASPALTSATYTFAATDDEKWVYIKSGTGWTAGWYQIVSVTTGVATLRAAAGEAIQETAPNLKANTALGCSTEATRADPNFGTFTMDYSQQDTAEKTHTDLATVDGVPDVDGCVVTSAEHAFGVQDVGNIIHIVSEAGDGTFTPGHYEIVSVSGVSATLDMACGTDGSNTVGLYYMGGAVNLGGATRGDSEFFAEIKASNTVYIQGVAGDAIDYTISEAVTPTVGADATPINFIGYITNRATVPTGTSRPKIDMQTFLFTASTYNNILNVDFTGDGVGVLNITTTCFARNIKVDNDSGTANRYSFTGAGAIVFDSEFKSTAGYPVKAGAGFEIFNSYVHGGSVCIYVDGSASRFFGNIIENCTVAGLQAGATSRERIIIVGNTFYGADHATADGILLTTTDSNRIFNNIIANWDVGLTNTGTDLQEDYNLFYGNGTNYSLVTGKNIGPHSVETVNNIWAGDPAAGVFTVNTEAKAKGFPGVFNGLSTTTGYTDVGAVQRVEPTGGGAWAN